MDIDIFGIVIAFCLILLGAVSERWWFVFLSALVFFALFPTITTFWILVGAIILSYIWANSFDELSSQGFLLIIVLIGSAVIAISLGEVFIGLLLSLALVFLFLLTPSVKLSKKVSRKAREEFDDIHAGLKKTKGQHPDLFGTVENLSKDTGAIAGEAWVTNPNQKLVSNDLVTRISQGSKNLLDGLGKLFK
ncbi:MAG: hypothetical protein J4215_02650 [Candidatus Diapherotrites archaeon]|uniref:Uncharacterized protein n=1 Tax=Candidatus Iainarchaeum sp. TaxID=3101447 RepID=A0A8T4L9R9_9ARCH|nr:hypothetical protein [Candidatus Diapherotrites archaeon]